MEYVIIGFISFGLGFIAGLTFGLSSTEAPAEAHSQETNLEEENINKDSANSIGDNNE